MYFSRFFTPPRPVGISKSLQILHNLTWLVTPPLILHSIIYGCPLLHKNYKIKKIPQIEASQTCQTIFHHSLSNFCQVFPHFLNELIITKNKQKNLPGKCEIILQMKDLMTEKFCQQM